MDSVIRGEAGRDVAVREPATDDEVLVSVVVPVKDGGEDLRRLLSSLRNQKGLRQPEIVVVDSGSMDRSPEIAHEFGANVIRIPPGEFSHSQTRNLAARQARGEYLLFMVQDALPPSESWLRDLVSLMAREGVAAVSCAERAREDADLFYKAMLWFHNVFMEVDGRDRIMAKPVEANYLSLRKNGQLSNVACLIPRKLFLQYGFRGDFAEDVELGVRLIKDGHKLALLGSNRVVHSHNRPAYYHLKRGYVDAVLFSTMFEDFPVAAIEVDDLFPSIAASFDIVDATARVELRQLAPPFPIELLSGLVLDRLQPGASGPARPDGPADFVDTDLESFLRRIRSRWPPTHSETTVNPAVLGAVSAALAGVFDYMKKTADTIDGPLLLDFTACLYKMWAIQCGCLLGASYVRGSAATREELRDIHAELTRGV